MRSISRALEKAQEEAPRSKVDAGAGAWGTERFVYPDTFEINTLVLQLQPQLASGHPKLFVTACGPKEGTTTIALELAKTLANESRPTLLCTSLKELGTRVSMLASVQDSNQRPVLSTSIPDLSVADISDLRDGEFDSESGSAFQTWLETESNFNRTVIVDVPPIIYRQSWLPLVRASDGIILVVEAEHTRKHDLSTTVKTLQIAGGRILGIVFNKFRPNLLNAFNFSST